MNRPLSKEERARYAEFLGDGTDDRCFLNQQWAQQLLAAHDFWREAVKNAPGAVREGLFDSREYCPFCNEEDSTETAVIHKPDCPWLLAREG